MADEITAEQESALALVDQIKATPLDPLDPTVSYNRDAVDVAFRRMMDEPAALTDRDIQSLQVVDEFFAQLARHRRAGGMAPWEHPGVNKEPITLGTLMLWLMNRDFVIDTCKLAIRELASQQARQTVARAPGDVSQESLVDVVRGLMQRVDELERSVPTYAGVYQLGNAYRKNEIVTWGGSMWIAKAATTAQPGLPDAESRAWQLCVKAGKDRR